MAPKLKVRPSRAQAEILQELQEWQGLALIWKKGSRAEWTGPAWPLVKKKLGSPKSSTVRKLVAEGWLAPLYEEDTPYWRITDEGIDALARYESVEIDPSDDMTAYDILRALDRKFKPPDWILADELTVPVYGGARRIDALAIGLSGEHWTTAFEIKVSRSDYIQELEDPKKRAPAVEIANQFYFVTPPNLLELEELPVEVGLMEVRDGTLHVRKEALATTRDQPTWRLVTQIAQKARRTK